MTSNVESALVPSRLLGELLIEKGLITPEEVEEALAEQKETGKRLGEILVKKGYVSGPTLTTVLAEQLGVDMEKQTGFGSGLWSEIKRRHPRGGRVQDAPPGTPEPPRETRLQLIDGLAEAVGVMREPDVDEPAAVVEEPEPTTPVEATPDLQADVEALRQQVKFAATRLDEERSAHEGTKRLLEDARAAQAEASGAADEADPAELAMLNDSVAALRAELETREAELAESVDARGELERVVAELESDLNELRDRNSGSDSANAELADKIRELRVENDEVKRRLIESRAAATAATDELAALKPQLDARAAAEAALAEVRSDAEKLSQSLDEERAAHEAARRDAERLESRRAELEPLERQLAETRTELEARTQMIAELTTELEAAKAAVDAVRSEAAESLDRERADAQAVLDAERAELRAEADELSQSLDEERAAHVAARRDAEFLESRSAELAVELEAVRAELAERPEPPPVEEPPSTHVVFLPVAEGYALEARSGPAPEVGGREELDGVHLRVARVGRSPLPADRRQCVFLEVA